MLQMDPEIRAKWTAKLRSDEFEQGVNRLNYIDPKDGRRKNCCLGVLCELAVDAGVVMTSEEGRCIAYGVYANATSLPEEVMEWCGLGSDDPILFKRPYADGSGGTPITCAAANDDEHLTFAQIADLIDGGEENDA